MLNRSLFEHAVVAWWLVLQDDRDGVMERIRRHREHAQVLYERHSALHPELELDERPDARQRDEDHVAELDRMFGSYGQVGPTRRRPTRNDAHWIAVEVHAVRQHLEQLDAPPRVWGFANLDSA
jgi:hypothetical protein